MVSRNGGRHALEYAHRPPRDKAGAGLLTGTGARFHKNYRFVKTNKILFWIIPTNLSHVRYVGLDQEQVLFAKPPNHTQKFIREVLFLDLLGHKPGEHFVRGMIARFKG